MLAYPTNAKQGLFRISGYLSSIHTRPFPHRKQHRAHVQTRETQSGQGHRDPKYAHLPLGEEREEYNLKLITVKGTI